MKNVYVPFDLPVFRNYNPYHPLLANLIEQEYDGIRFVHTKFPDPDQLSGAEVFKLAIEFVEKIAAAMPPHLRRDEDSLIALVASRDLVSQAHVNVKCDLAFYHTTPVIVNQMPYILHFESPTTLFYPYILHGKTWGLKLSEKYSYWYIRAMLESVECRRIFTNLAMSKRQIDTIFKSDIISGKTEYIAPGPYITRREVEKVDEALSAMTPSSHVEILFTNSWHQGTDNFFFRGGLDLLVAFQMMEEYYPDVHLTIRSSWPQRLNGTALHKFVSEHRKITLLPNKVTDEEMMDLFIRADIFCLDAASVHSISVLRAMYCGAVCIVSDSPGYEEYIEHNVTGLVIRGRKAAVYSEEPETGFLCDNFETLFTNNKTNVIQMAEALRALCDNPERRITIGKAAHKQVREKNSFSNWRDGFERIMRDALLVAGVKQAV